MTDTPEKPVPQWAIDAAGAYMRRLQQVLETDAPTPPDDEFARIIAAHAPSPSAALQAVRQRNALEDIRNTARILASGPDPERMAEMLSRIETYATNALADPQPAAENEQGAE